MSAKRERERKLYGSRARSIAGIHARPQDRLSLASVMTFYLRARRHGEMRLTRQKYTSSDKFARFFFILNWPRALYRIFYVPSLSDSSTCGIHFSTRETERSITFLLQRVSLSLPSPFSRSLTFLPLVLAFSLMFTSGFRISYC